jgi:hypothetical protein
MRQAMHLFAAAIFLLLGTSVRPITKGEDAPEFRDFHRRIWAAEVNMADSNMKTIYGRLHWERLSRNVRQTRFMEALRIVSDRHAYGDGKQQLLLVSP